VAPVRRNQAKYGFGVAIDQTVIRDASAFVRGSMHDGRTETFSFTEIDRSLSAGASMRGPLWRRPGDTVGAAWAVNGLSPSHREYLARGGLGFFLGDGALNYQEEQIIEVYYSAAAYRGLWVSLDYQHIWNPGYNADRGPVDFFGVRVHLEL
jgi:carbohydrate-selective porin OprB